MADRQLKIKVGVLRRVKKDLEYYDKEHKAQQNKIMKMRQDGKNEYDIKKQEEVLIETETMLPDCQMRLKEAANDLKAFLSSIDKDKDTLSTEVLDEGNELLISVATLV